MIGRAYGTGETNAHALIHVLKRLTNIKFDESCCQRKDNTALFLPKGRFKECFW